MYNNIWHISFLFKSIWEFLSSTSRHLGIHIPKMCVVFMQNEMVQFQHTKVASKLTLWGFYNLLIVTIWSFIMDIEVDQAYFMQML